MLAVTVIGVRPSLLTMPAVKNGPIRARLPGNVVWRPGAVMVTCCRDAYWSEMSQSEVAEYLHIPLGTVKTRTRSALSRLAVILEGEVE